MVGYTYQFTDTAHACRRIIQSGRIDELLHISGLFASMAEFYYRGEPEDYSASIDFPVTAPSADTYSDPHISGGGQGQTQVTHAMGMVLWVTDQSISSSRTCGRAPSKRTSNDGTNERYGPFAEHEVYPADALHPPQRPHRRTSIQPCGGGNLRRTVDFLEATYRPARPARPIRVEELRTDSKEPSA